MRYLLFLLVIPHFAKAQLTPKEFQVIIKLDSIKVGEKLYLEYANPSAQDNPGVIDSIVFSGETPIFKGKIVQPVSAMIYRYKDEIKDTAFITSMMKDIPLSEEEKQELLAYLLNSRQQQLFEFFLMPGEITIKGKNNLFLAKVDGPKPVMDFEQLKTDDKDYFQEHMTTADMMAVTKKDSASKEEMMKKMDTMNKKMREEVYLGYVQKNPSSPLVLYALGKGVPHHIDSADKYIQLFHTFSPEIQQWPSAIRFLATLEASKKSEIGRIVSDFKQEDSLGKTVKFSSYKGRYVLIDLWASWCGPCRTKHPELVKIYKKYSQENFSILGIALEQKEDRDKWLKAIQQDKLLWVQVTDFKFWKNAVAQQFGVQAIPFNLLVDPNGKIIAKNIRGAELDNRLAEIFKK